MEGGLTAQDEACQGVCAEQWLFQLRRASSGPTAPAVRVDFSPGAFPVHTPILPTFHDDQRHYTPAFTLARDHVPISLPSLESTQNTNNTFRYIKPKFRNSPPKSKN